MFDMLWVALYKATHLWRERPKKRSSALTLECRFDWKKSSDYSQSSAKNQDGFGPPFFWGPWIILFKGRVLVHREQGKKRYAGSSVCNALDALYKKDSDC